eukprot:5941387-Lingulodinium_polyedra.AAC.1
MADAGPEERRGLEAVNWADRGAVAAQIVEAEAAYRQAVAGARKRRSDGWNGWVRDALANGAGR